MCECVVLCVACKFIYSGTCIKFGSLFFLLLTTEDKHRIWLNTAGVMSTLLSLCFKNFWRQKRFQTIEL